VIKETTTTTPGAVIVIQPRRRRRPAPATRLTLRLFPRRPPAGRLRYPRSPSGERRGRPSHHRHRIRHQLVAGAEAFARRHHRLRGVLRAGRGLRADGLLPRGRVRRGLDAAGAIGAGSPGTRPRPTRRASRSARPARATRLQGLRPQLRRGAALDLDDAREKRATWRRISQEGTRGASTATPSAPCRAVEAEAARRAAPRAAS
jgi:hypothetical protein